MNELDLYEEGELVHQALQVENEEQLQLQDEVTLLTILLIHHHHNYYDCSAKLKTVTTRTEFVEEGDAIKKMGCVFQEEEAEEEGT